MKTLMRLLFALIFGLTLLAAHPADVALAFDTPTTDVQMVTADDINNRIDNSEDTTLSLSDDIGEMADRILWTEGQIGEMADRIVESEYLINTGTQQSVDQVQETITLVQP